MTVESDPLKDLVSIQQRVNALFEDTLTRSRISRPPHPAGPPWAPAVDIFETEETVIILADLPGVPRESISVEVKEGVLSLRGERRFDSRIDPENVHRMERSYGPFLRTFTLPNSIHYGQIKAFLREGILEIVLPKITVGNVRSIHIKVE